jgi:hypothetical protein
VASLVAEGQYQPSNYGDRLLNSSTLKLEHVLSPKLFKTVQITLRRFGTVTMIFARERVNSDAL